MKTHGRSTWICKLVLLFLGMPLAYSPVNASSEPLGGRFAVVIGNSRYGGGNDVSGVEDARAMAEYLQRLQFAVLRPVLNGRLEDMRKRLEDLKAVIGQASTVVFFYSGHGFQLNSKDYLMPIGGSINPASSLPIDEVQRALAFAPNEAVKLVFLDACRSESSLPPGRPQGLAQTPPPLPRTLYAYAAGPDLVAASGSSDGRSPYATALLRYLREPGLEIRDLLSQVNDDVSRDSGGTQSPIALGIDQIPREFFLQAPVMSRFKIAKADDSLVVILNGEIVLDSNQQGEKDLRLKAGRNDLVLMVSNGRALHNGQTWGPTEGWSYDMPIFGPDGEILCSEGGQEVRCFKDEGEEVPFKDGPRHGKVFMVARANLFVDPETTTLSVLNRDLDVWKEGNPFWAQDQGLLDFRSLQDLDLKPQDVIGNIDLGPLRPVAEFLLVEILRSGKLLGLVVAEPKDTLVTVRGNRALSGFVKTCMSERRDDRIRDLQASVAAALNRKDRPFSIFDEGLSRCVQDIGRSSPFRTEDMLVWTALESRRSLKP